MEENYSNSGSARPQLIISDIAMSYLSETGKWAKFLSIVGFVLAGLMVIAGFFVGTILSMLPYNEMGGMPSGFNSLFTVIYVLIGVLYFFPSWYLYKFSEKLSFALSSRNNEVLTEALENHKSFYKFWGIFTIIILSIYALFFVFGILLSSMA